jgi:enoyl-CoA hydratase/carnithine racemase
MAMVRESTAGLMASSSLWRAATHSVSAALSVTGGGLGAGVVSHILLCVGQTTLGLEESGFGLFGLAEEGVDLIAHTPLGVVKFL